MSYPYQPPQKHFKKWVRYLSWQWYQLQNLEGFSIHYLFGVAFDWFMCLPKKANNLQVLLKKGIYWNCKILIGLGGPFRSSIQAKLEKGGIAEGESQGTLCDHSNAQSPMKDLLWEGLEKGPPLYYVQWNHKQEIRETLKPLLFSTSQDVVEIAIIKTDVAFKTWLCLNTKLAKRSQLVWN